MLEGVNVGGWRRGKGDICNTFNTKDKLKKEKEKKTELAHMIMTEATNMAGKQLYHLGLILTWYQST